jgi:hypothetical protein
MPQNTTITCAAGTWTLLTDTNITALRVVNMGVEGVWLQATAGTTPPTTTDGALPLLPNQILAADLELSQVFPGVAGANRVYALTAVETKLSVSHA